ncbi:twin-arginine translocase TatA/TatE family subunit [Thermodesulfobacteriota bacterium]
MFGISMWEIVIVLVVALLILGPKQLVETARVMGNLYREIQKWTSELRGTVEMEAPNWDSVGNSPSPSSTEPPKTAESESDMLPQSGEKAGPDFYADLLESSKETDPNEPAEKTEADGDQSKSPEIDEETSSPKNESKEGKDN